MSSAPYEFAIFGSTPLAGLLAGLLAAGHRRRVLLIAETPSPFRLPTGFDLSVGPITRPETWALQKAGTTETLQLLRRMQGSSAIRHTDPLFVAQTGAGNAALSHIRMMAMGFGLTAEPAPIGDGQFGVRMRDAVLLDRPTLAPRLAAWLGRGGVDRLEARQVKATFDGDGSVRIDHLGQRIEADRAVLADDHAILVRLAGALDERSLTLRQSTVTLTAPTWRPAAPLVFDLDRDLRLVEAGGGQMLAYGAEHSGDVPKRGGGLMDIGPLRRLARRQLRRVATTDGAPLVGPVPDGNATVIAGFGVSGVFFAPALARYLVGASSPAEGAYFAARHTGARVNVADYTAPLAREALA